MDDDIEEKAGIFHISDNYYLWVVPNKIHWKIVEFELSIEAFFISHSHELTSAKWTLKADPPSSSFNVAWGRQVAILIETLSMNTSFPIFPTIFLSFPFPPAFVDVSPLKYIQNKRTTAFSFRVYKTALLNAAPAIGENASILA